MQAPLLSDASNDIARAPYRCLWKQLLSGSTDTDLTSRGVIHGVEPSLDALPRTLAR